MKKKGLLSPPKPQALQAPPTDTELGTADKSGDELLSRMEDASLSSPAGITLRRRPDGSPEASPVQAKSDGKEEKIVYPKDLEQMIMASSIPATKELHAFHIKMNGSLIYSKFMNDFCKPLVFNVSLEILTVSDCELAADQANRLATGLKNHPTLRRLCLRGNTIRSGGVDLMAGSIKGNTRLTSLDLDENAIGPAFPMSIILALPSLSKLNLYDNVIKNIPQKLLTNLPQKLDDVCTPSQTWDTVLSPSLTSSRT
mmetsp:Transcript_49160/g.76692  ORF Transcript_49160/g.76692 Transcript_49160/m.76692 type:complete len:256 (-) Transcript_49160:199-966(-)